MAGEEATDEAGRRSDARAITARADPMANYGRQMSQLMTDSEPGQAPLKPRALILDLFGDYLRYAGGEAKAGDLVQLLGVFGVEPATVRMTLSRLRAEKWFTTRREGRESSYVLSAHMLAVLRQGRERIFADYDEPWDGSWTTVVQQSTKPDRTTRDQVRRQLSWLGFGSLTASTWMTPRDRRDQVTSLTDDFPEVRFIVMRSQVGDLEVDRDIVAQCWDLDRINGLYEQFLSEHAHLTEAGSLEGAQALVARTTLIAGYRHFPFLDPWLPGSLRPDGWLGTEANQLFRTVHAALGPASTEFVGDVIGSRIDTPAS